MSSSSVAAHEARRARLLSAPCSVHCLQRPSRVFLHYKKCCGSLRIARAAGGTKQSDPAPVAATPAQTPLAAPAVPPSPPAKQQAQSSATVLTDVAEQQPWAWKVRPRAWLVCAALENCRIAAPTWGHPYHACGGQLRSSGGALP